MELVYLWVKKYNNIKNQGFNFSPRFTCSYAKDKLTIKKNDDSMDDFFGKNINITAIVGRNGSGKTNILKSILQIDDFENNYIVVYENNGVCYFNSNLEAIQTTIQKESADQLLKSVIAYIDYEHKHPAYRNYRIIKANKKSVINVLVNNEVKNKIFKISTFMYIPSTIEITYKKSSDLSAEFIDHIPYTKREEFEGFFKGLNDYSFHQFLAIKYIETNALNVELDIFKNEGKLFYPKSQDNNF